MSKKEYFFDGENLSTKKIENAINVTEKEYKDILNNKILGVPVLIKDGNVEILENKKVKLYNKLSKLEVVFFAGIKKPEGFTDKKPSDVSDFFNEKENKWEKQKTDKEEKTPSELKQERIFELKGLLNDSDHKFTLDYQERSGKTDEYISNVKAARKAWYDELIELEL